MGPEKLRLFEDKKVRVKWNVDEEDYYFSIVDVISVLTEKDFQTARKYWNKLNERLLDEGNQTVTNYHQLKLIMGEIWRGILYQAHLPFISQFYILKGKFYKLF